MSSKQVRYIWTSGHVEVYSSSGMFLLSADTRREAEELLEELMN